MKKIIIAPDSFKESLTALEAASAIEKGFRSVFPDAELVKIPMADGGEGTVQSLVDATKGEIVSLEVTGPLGKPVKAFYGMLGDGRTAVIEMAAASGIAHVPLSERNPLVTTTFGTGQQILAALDRGVSHIILGLGGSATNDGGAGMAATLGVRFLDKSGKEIGWGGGELGRLHQIDISGLDKRLSNVSVVAACDVDNLLTGPTGASAIFGPQKGATPDMVLLLDANLGHYAKNIQKTLGLDLESVPGAGAAGGLGAGELAFLKVELKRGIDIVVEASGLKDAMKGADLVITGEGRIDSQTIYGKTPIGVAKTAKAFGIPTLALAGCVSADYAVVLEHGLDAVFPIIPGIQSLDQVLREGAINLERTARNAAALLKLPDK
ncbi:glycerate kinase [Paenibacillus larvae]